MNTDPPVLPCLQKLNRHKLDDTKLEIDGWDCWFNRDLENLHLHWPHFKKNNLTVGELWLGFLRYYTEVLISLLITFNSANVRLNEKLFLQYILFISVSGINLEYTVQKLSIMRSYRLSLG